MTSYFDSLSGSTTPAPTPEPCQWCSNTFRKVYHDSAKCPKVKEIEYFPDGRIKKVVFNA